MRLLVLVSALSPDDASLDTDITALGLSSYINTANNAPNSEREQQVAGELYRGDGTADGALLRIQERLATIEREQEAYLSDSEPAAPNARTKRGGKRRDAGRPTAKDADDLLGM